MKSTLIDDLARSLCLPSSTAAESFIDVSMEKSFKQSSQLVGEVIRQFNILYCAATPKSKIKSEKSIALTIDFAFYYIYVLYIRLYIHYITLNSTDSSLFLSFIINRASMYHYTDACMDI